MKILMLIDSLNIGGAETHVETLCIELSKIGHKISLISSGGKIFDRLQKQNFRCIHIPNITNEAHSRKNLPLIFRLFAARRIISNEIRNFAPDVVHAHTRRTAFLSKGICRRQNVPLIVTAHAKFSMNFPKNLLSEWGDFTVSVSCDIKEHLLAHGVPKSRVKVIENGVNLPSINNKSLRKSESEK